MTDHVLPAKRSDMMSRVKSKNTAPEKKVRSWLHKNGYRFSLHRKDLPGCPDIVLPKYKTVIFVHGCFWHRHEGCKLTTTPKTRTEFWAKKFKANVERDRCKIAELKSMGWNIIVVWECETKNDRHMLDVLEKTAETMRN